MFYFSTNYFNFYLLVIFRFCFFGGIFAFLMFVGFCLPWGQKEIEEESTTPPMKSSTNTPFLLFSLRHYYFSEVRKLPRSSFRKL